MEKIVIVIVGIIAFAVLLPVIFNSVYPTYTLNSVTNESVAISGSKGQLVGYPVDTSFTPIVSNRTHLFTASTHYNITASNGTMFTSSYIATSPVNVTYKWQPTSYLTTSTQRSISSVVFTMGLLSLLVIAGFMVIKG